MAGLLAKLKRHPKRLVFPEAEDDRVLRTACRLVQEEAALPILLGNPEAVSASLDRLGLPCQFINTIDPASASDLDLFCERYVRMEGFRGVRVADPREVMVKPHYFASMMVQYGQADAMVAGNRVHPSIVYRAARRMIKPLPRVPQPFSAAVLICERDPAHPRLFVVADCGMHHDPGPELLAGIAVETGTFARQILGRAPRVALLSHSTKGSASSASSLKMASATALARSSAAGRALDMEIEGELQADVAVVPDLAEAREKPTLLGGQADVLVFPDANAADISLRLLTRLAGMRAYGEILLGLGRPVARVPRVTDEATILGTSALAAVEAINFHELYPEGETGGIIW